MARVEKTVFVSYHRKDICCAWADRRLPTEAGREKAARGADANIYPWASAEPNNNLPNYNGVVGDTTEVGKYPEGISPYGALDMAGNVWEWVEDWYVAYPGNTVSDSDYGTKYKALRGGSWDNFNPNILRSANRDRLHPSDSVINLGFRCAMSASE